MKTGTKVLIITSLLAFIVFIVRLHGINEEIKNEEREQRLEEIRIENERREAERQAVISEVVSTLNSNPREAIESAINIMTSYSDLVRMLGTPDKIDRRINGADLAVWRIDGLTIFMSESRKGTTDVYAFEGYDVKTKFVERTFNRMLLD